MEPTLTAFFESKIIASGDRESVTRRIEDGYAATDFAAIQIFDDASGARVDLDYWDAGEAAPPRGPGRPKLGVTAREVTLLPRHWSWLQRQKGGASASIRRLVDEAMRAPVSPEARRDAVYRFATAMCGDAPGYEEAMRSLYRGDQALFSDQVSTWPEDVKSYIVRLLGNSAGEE